MFARMQTLRLLVALSILVSVACGDQQQANAAAVAECAASVTKSSRLGHRPCQGELIFEDTFDTLDLTKWQHEVTMAGGGNWEFQVYWNRSENSFTKNGHLVIHPGRLADVYDENFLSSGTLDLGPSCTASYNDGCARTGTPTNILNPTTSARLHTVDSFSFRYGKVEVRAKMPAGDWLWPAIWLLPRDQNYGGWPMSGEIDLLESRGNRDLVSAEGTNIGVEQAGSTLHWGPRPDLNRFQKTMWTKQVDRSSSLDKDFHLYQLEWTPEHIKFSIDNVEFGKISPPAGGFWKLGDFSKDKVNNPWLNGTHMAPFDQEFYLILNLAVGGTNGFFPDNASNRGGKPWNHTSTHAYTDFWKGRSQWESTWHKDGSTDLQVDYVRVWAL